MTRTRLRWLLPLAAALAVVLLVGLVWWATARDDSTPVEDQVAGGSVNPSGDSEPGSPGTAEPLPTTPPLDPNSPVPQPSNPRSVLVDSYFPRSDTVLALNYAVGIPECYGEVGTPEVTETDDAVVVRLERIEPKQRTDVACIDIALLKTVEVQLSRPLGDRVVKDAGYDDHVVPRADAPYENGDK